MSVDIFDALVTVRCHIAEAALTASVLGAEREGHGVVVSDKGLVLTVGYIVTEAESIWIVDKSGNAVAGHLLGYDQISGLGLVQILGALNTPNIKIGRSEELAVGQKMLLAGVGGRKSALDVTICELAPFAGYWEYLLDKAIFTEPAHPDWGGTALVGADNKLYGIGSLILQPENKSDSARNMVIPIDLYSEIIDDLLAHGQRNTAPRPWIGWYIQNTGNGPVVLGTVDSAPAEKAGIEDGDIVVAVNSVRVHSITETYKAIWSAGQAGVKIDLAIRRDGELRVVAVSSVDRADMLWRAPIH